MARLIDAEPYDELLELRSVQLRDEMGSLGGAVSGCRKLLAIQPTIDPVHAAGACRCHECIHWKEPWLVDQTLGKCRLGKTAMTKPEHFCGYGVRREDHERETDRAAG